MANVKFVKNTYSVYTAGKTQYDANGTIFFCTDRPLIIANGVEYGVSQEIIEANLDGVKSVEFASATNTITVKYFKSGTPDTVINLSNATSSQAGLMSAEDKGNLDSIKETVDAIEGVLGSADDIADALTGLEVESTDKTVTVTKGTNGGKTNLAVNVDGTTILKNAQGVLSVAPSATTPYTGTEAIEVTGTDTGKTIALKIAEANKILSQSADGLTASLSFSDNDTAKKIELKGVGGVVVADFSYEKFIVDGMLDDVKLQGNNLVFTFNTAAGPKTIDPVDLSKYIDVYTAGDGIAISGSAISVKVKEGDKYLQVTEDGVASKGIDAAIEAALGWYEA